MRGSIKSAAVMMVVANRGANLFLVDEDEKNRIEYEGGKVCFEALYRMNEHSKKLNAIDEVESPVNTPVDA